MHSTWRTNTFSTPTCQGRTMTNDYRWIEDRLSALEASEEIRILFACESGSRAWGFPSADSGFDVRSSALESIGFWQGRFGFSQEGRSQKTVMRASRRVRVAQSACARSSIVDWQGRFGFSQEVRSPRDGHAWEPPQHGMTCRPWPLSKLSGTNLNEGPRKHLLSTYIRARRICH